MPGQLSSRKVENMRNVFRASLLEPCQQWMEGKATSPPAIQVDGEEEFEVEKVLDGKSQYLVKGLGYS